MAAYKKLGIRDSEEDNKWIKLVSKEAEDEVAQERKSESLEKQSRGKPLPQQPPPCLSNVLWATVLMKFRVWVHVTVIY